MDNQDQKSFSVIRGMGSRPVSDAEAAMGGAVAGLLSLLGGLIFMPMKDAIVAGLVLGLGTALVAVRRSRRRRT